MGNSIKPHIERAEKTGACNLSKQGLTEFPDDLFRVIKNLRTLDLSENKLPVLPSRMGSFSVLKHLVVTSNRIRTLPEDIGQLQKLENFSLNHNRLTALPTSMANLQSLRTLSVANNFIKVFPTQLAGLKNLDSIDLSGNKLTEIPNAVKDLNVIELNVNQNQINQMSDSIAECPRLKVLRVEENCLDISALTPKLLKNSLISVLAIEGNLFEMKKFNDLDGYDEYMERYTATKKKFN